MSHLTGKRVECKQSAVSDDFLLQNYDSDIRILLSYAKIVMVSDFY